MTCSDEEIRLADEDSRKGLSWTEFDTLLEDVMAQLAPADANATGSTDASSTPPDEGSPDAGAIEDALAPGDAPTAMDDSFELAFERELESAEGWDDPAEGAPAPVAGAPAAELLVTSFLRSSSESAWGPRAKAAVLAGTLLAVSAGLGSIYFAMSDGTARVVDASRAPAGEPADGGRIKAASLLGAALRMTVATRSDPAVDAPMPRLVRTIRIVAEPPAAEKVGVSPEAEVAALNGKSILDRIETPAGDPPAADATASQPAIDVAAAAPAADPAIAPEAPAAPAIEAPADAAEVATTAEAGAEAAESTGNPAEAAGEEKVAEVFGPRPRPLQAGEQPPIPRPAPDRRAL